MISNRRQEVLLYNNTTPIAHNFLSTFTKWAKIWISSSTSTMIPRKRKIETREMDVRPRKSYQDAPCVVPVSQRVNLYQLTCQKLRPTTSPKRLRKLGDILHVRHFWDDLERLVYHELSANSHYIPPTKRLPFSPDKPGSIYLPRKSKRNLDAQRSPNTRKSFASSTIVYNSIGECNTLVPVIIEEDDDDIPLGSLKLRL